MDAVNNLPKPVVIGAVIVVLLIAGFVVFSTVNGIVTNNGYGTKADIARRQQQGGGASNGGRTAPAGVQGQNQGYGNNRGGYPGGYGSQGSSGGYPSGYGSQGSSSGR
jgi:hypothetical protein